MRQELEQLFVNGAKQLVRLRERADSETVRWVFLTYENVSLDDLHKPGLGSIVQPGPEGAQVACGYDAAERLSVLKHFDCEDLLGDLGREKTGEHELWKEEFFSHSGDGVKLLEFKRGDRGEPANAKRGGALGIPARSSCEEGRRA